MALEIEKKFLVSDSSFKELSEMHENIVQGYLCKEPQRTVRVRLKGDRGFITIKGITEGCVRREYEYPIPCKDAKELLELCHRPLLEKTRWYVRYEGHLWEIDEFHGAQEGLIVAEIELPSVDTPFSLPSFVSEEVTGDPRYYNSNL